MKKSAGLLFAVACAVAASSQFASASTVNFGGTFSGTASASGSFPSISETFSGSGSDTTFGAFDIIESANVDLSGLPTVNISGGNVQFTFLPSLGGFTADFTGTGSASGPTATVSLNFNIVSGLLAGETGTMTGTGTFNSETNFLLVNYTGTINGDGPILGFIDGPTVDVSSTPVPAALPMFLSGASILGLFARRKKEKSTA